MRFPLLLVAVVLLVCVVPQPLRAPLAVSISGDVSAPTSTIPNAFSTITVWNADDLSSPPPPGLASSYPFLTHVELFTATGGCYTGFAGCTSDRDLLNVPASGMAGGVNASRLFAPLRNILAAHLKPHIVTGNVPVALSGGAARIGGFGVNNALPANVSEYANYIEQVAAQLVAEFGLPEVATWRWGVYTEFNNQDWLNASAAAYAELYDFTVCGLERALGAANVDVGVHGCTQCRGAKDWDPVLFLEHAATGVSSCSGGRVHLNWTGNSFYEQSVDAPGDLSSWTEGRSILDAARALGLPTRRFGIDEGRLLWGPEGSSFALTTRAVGDSYQGSFDALFFKVLTLTGTETYYSRWGVNSGPGLFAAGDGAVDNVAVNTAQLAFRLNGSAFVPTTNTTASPPSLSIVDSVVGASEGGVLRALVFHHHPLLNVTGVASAVASVSLCGLGASVPSGPVDGAVAWRVDDEHAQFWPAWRADAASANISRAGGDYNSGWSEFSDNMPLASARAIGLLAANTARYRELATLKAEPLGTGGGGNTGAVVGADGCVRFDIVLPPHGVALVELPSLCTRHLT